jgi:hypothetical protein
MLLAKTVTPPLAAQTVRTGSITATVTDDTRSALPGVTVTVTGPALQVPQLVQVTGTDGGDEIKDPAPGADQIVFEFTGFARLIRQGIVLTTGFVARGADI